MYKCCSLQAEKEEILDGIREMTRDIKLKDLIIAAFIPPVFQEKIVQHAEWDEYESTWAIGAMEFAGNALRAQRDMAVAQQAHIKATYGNPGELALLRDSGIAQL